LVRKGFLLERKYFSKRIGMFQKIVYISVDGKEGREGKEKNIPPFTRCQLIFEKI